MATLVVPFPPIALAEVLLLEIIEQSVEQAAGRRQFLIRTPDRRG
jgi:hypothetical protein